MKHKVDEKLVAKIVQEAVNIFPSFGDGKDSEFNPMAHALKGLPPMFAAGVDISAVARLMLQMSKRDALLEALQYIADGCFGAMEGAGLPEFQHYEHWMVTAKKAIQEAEK